MWQLLQEGLVICIIYKITYPETISLPPPLLWWVEKIYLFLLTSKTPNAVKCSRSECPPASVILMGVLTFLNAINGLSQVPSVHSIFSNTTIFWEQNQHMPVSALFMHDTDNKDGGMMLAWGPDPKLSMFCPGPVADFSLWTWI